MGEKFNNFKKLIKSILNSVTKHRLILFCTVLTAAFGITSIWLDSDIGFYKVSEKLCLSFLMATLFLLPVTYITEHFSSLKKYLIQIITIFVSGSGTYCILQFVKSGSYKDMYYLGIAFAIICLTVTIFVPRENSKAYYANLIKNFLFCGLISLVGLLGTYLLIYAFSNLIIEIEDLEEIFESFAIFWSSVVFINLFVFYLFEKREEPSGKAFKIIFIYILFPVYGFLLAILYGYLLKALFTLSLPNGQINWFVSFATVFYLVFYFVFREYEDNKLIKFFYRFGALIFIPLICVQFPAYFIRVSGYGLTGWRYSSLLYNIFVVIFIIFTFIKKGKYTKFAIPVLGGFVLLASVTPLNLIDVAFNSQYSKMLKVLEKYNMISGEKLTDYSSSEVDKSILPEDRESLYSAYRYIQFTSEHKKPEFFNTSKDFEEIFKIREKVDNDSSLIKYRMQAVKDRIVDVKGFSTIQKFYYSQYYSSNYTYPATLPYSGKKIDISKEFLDLNESFQDFLIIKIDDNTQAYLFEVDYDYNKEKEGFESYNFSYYLMKK